MPFSKYLEFEKCEPETAHRIQLWIIGIAVISIVLITYSPIEYLFKYLGYKDSNGCPLLTFTGVPCPMCGMGRSFWGLITLNRHEVFYYNPSGAVVFPIAGIIIIAIFIMSLFNYRVKLNHALLKLWYVPVLLLIAVWVLNITLGHH